MKKNVRTDYDDFFEIDVTITDIHLNEFEETILYPCNHMAITWEKDGSYSYQTTAIESFKEESRAMRTHPLAAFPNKNNNLYNIDNVLRIKFDSRWRKV
jgi:hypothetical protein